MIDVTRALPRPIRVEPMEAVQKSLELILARNLLSSISTPAFLIGTAALYGLLVHAPPRSGDRLRLRRVGTLGSADAC